MRFEMSKMTMSALAEMLTPFVDRPVIDRTGLKATYPVTLDVPFDAMMRVIQNLGGTAAVQGGSVGFAGGGFGGGFGGFGGGAGGAPGAGKPGGRIGPGGIPSPSVSAATRPEAPVW
jgi:hypothetical protein